MATTQKTFNGKYKAIVETNFNGEGGTGCWISYSKGGKEYTGSLEFLDDHGVLEDRAGYVHDVEQAIIDDIRQWAIENGY